VKERKKEKEVFGAPFNMLNLQWFNTVGSIQAIQLMHTNSVTT
jgi:hypothetical protein